MPLLRRSDYRVWLIGDTANVLGSAIRNFCMPLLILDVTGSALVAGISATVALVCQSIGQIPGGAVVDRYNRRLLLLVSAVAGASTYLGMLALYLLDALSVPALLLISGVSGIRAGLFGSITDVCLKSVVPARDLSSAFAVNIGRDSTIGLVGGPVGGVLFSVGRIIPFVVDAASYLGLIYLAKRIKCDLGPSRCARPQATLSLFRDVSNGWVWIWNRATVWQLILISSLVMCGVSGVLLANILDWTKSGVPAATIGLLETMVGLGALLGSLLAAKLSRMIRGSWLIIFGSFFLGLLLAATALDRSLPFVLACYGLAFVALPIINAAAGGYLMAFVPGDYQGRVWSAAGMVSMGFGAIAPVVVGVLVDAEASGSAIAIFGGLIVVAAGVAVFSSGIRAISTSDAWVEEG